MMYCEREVYKVELIELKMYSIGFVEGALSVRLLSYIVWIGGCDVMVESLKS